MTYIDTIRMFLVEYPVGGGYPEPWILTGISVCQWVQEGMPAKEEL